MSRHSMANPPQRVELTERQEDVIRLVARGLTNPEIAERLGISLDGAKWHVSEILTRLGASTREEAVKRWREERRLGRRVRHWAGAAWGSITLRVTGAVLAGGAGLTGIAAMAGAFAGPDAPADESLAVAAATPTATPVPDPATVEGLTLRAEDARADDTQTLIEVSLEGRPELGRIFGFEPKLGPGPEISRVRAVDDAGAIYNVGVVEHDGNRGMVLHFAPVSPNTLWLDLIVPAVSFVAPEDEPGPGEAPPVASSSVGGPWRVRIDEIPRTDVVRIPLHLEPQALGAGAAVPFEVIQTAQGTVLGIRFDGVGDPGDAGFVPFPELRWSDGERVPGRNGAPQTGSGVVYMAYEPTHGEVTLTLRPFIIVGLPDNVCTALDEQNCVPREEIERRGPEVEARRTALEALFADQPLPSWKFTIP